MENKLKNVIKLFLLIYFLGIVTILPVKASEVDNVVVKLTDGMSVKDFLVKNNLSEEEISVGKNGYVLIKNQEAQTMTSGWEGVQKFENDDLAYTQQATLVPDDHFYMTEQWNMPIIGMEEVWPQYKGNNKVVVAVLDTGLNFSHEDMRNLIWTNTKEIAGNGIDDDNNGYVDDYNGYNFVGLNNKINDDNDHGTAVSSIIAANSNNEKGIAGINWQVQIMPVKVASSSGSASLFDIAQGIYYATDNGARVINMSLGSLVDRDYVREAVQYAADHNVLMVAAAGNSHIFSPIVKTLYYPARYPEVLAVGATGRDEKIATLSNASFLSHYGPDLDMVAPGVEIIAADADKSNDGYKYYDGTSLASPHVAGAAALLLSKNYNLKATELRDALLLSADKNIATDGDFDEKYGYGRLNVAQAMAMIPADGSIDDDPNDDNDQYGNVYLAKWKNQSNYWYLKPGEKRKMWVEFENVGNALWKKDAFNALHLATDKSKDRMSLFFDETSWLSANRIEMVQLQVKPGEIARFEFEIQAPNNVGDYKEYFGLVSENNSWLNDMGVYWELKVTRDNVYSAWWNDQSEYLTLNAGKVGDSWIEYINNGTVDWQKEGLNAIHLGTDRPMDRSSNLFDSNSWLTNNRIELDQTTVAPGEIGKFSFGVVSDKKGFYREYFRPVVENITWLRDWGVYLDYSIN